MQGGLEKKGQVIDTSCVRVLLLLLLPLMNGSFNERSMPHGTLSLLPLVGKKKAH